MPDCEQVKRSLGAIKRVDHTVIAYPNAKGVHPLQSVVGMGVEAYSEAINAGFDAGLDSRGQPKEISIEIT